MQKEKWMIYSKRADFNRIGEKYSISPVIARIIRNRDVTGEKDIALYLNGSIDNLYSSWLLKDMDKAVDIVNIKINQHNKIRIISDYDIDGICSGYILIDALKRIGANVDLVVPHRIEDGYGLNEKLIELAHHDKVDTIITCDNGIAAKDAVNKAKELGMTVIITDHHEVPFEEEEGEVRYVVPNADAIVNQKQVDCEYPFKEMCGAMVAYKFIEALYESRGFSDFDVKEYLEFVAIATVGDVVDLIGENRIVTKYGIELLRKTKNVGLRALIEECNLEKDKINSYHIGFILGPCLNASGRLDTAKKAVELLQSDSNTKASMLASELKRLNDERKKLTEIGVEKACKIAGECKDNVLVIYLEDCHESIAGIIAGRVREKYNKPTIVLTKSESGVKGSGRSIECYDMYKELTKVKNLFTKFGGHKMAAGLSMEEDKISEFRSEINNICTLTEDDLIPTVWIDTELPIGYIDYDFLEEIEKLEPFGKGNPKPVFAAKDIAVKKMDILGNEGNVLRLKLTSSDGYEVLGVCFNKTKEFINFVDDKFGHEELVKATRGVNNNISLKVIYYPTINVYNGRSNIQIVINSFC